MDNSLLHVIPSCLAHNYDYEKLFHSHFILSPLTLASSTAPINIGTLRTTHKACKNDLLLWCAWRKEIERQPITRSRQRSSCVPGTFSHHANSQ
jgi:hypothetical protein